MKLPSLEAAMAMLGEASLLNPGPWVQHSMYTAEAARLITQDQKS